MIVIGASMGETMHAIVKCHAGKGLQMSEARVPAVGASDVLVKVTATSICGTDLHIYNWDPWAAGRIKPPVIVGHEFCGEVVERGSQVGTVSVGDFISAESHIVCGVCDLCRTGNGHICRSAKIIRLARDGLWGQCVAIPAFTRWVNTQVTP